MNNIVLTEEEKKYWLCSNCECEAINCECGDKQNIFEISELSHILGSNAYPAKVKYDPLIKKVIVKVPIYLELNEDYEISKLKDLGFVITRIVASKSDDIATVTLRRKEHYD